MLKETEMTVLKEIRDLLKGLKVVEVKTKDERFVMLSDGWIQDKKTGLEWVTISDSELNFQKAEKYCADKGGRMPTVDELLTLIDKTKYNPATEMPGMKPSWYWASDKVVWNADYAWCVDFSNGGVGCSSKDFETYVRPVRSSQ